VQLSKEQEDLQALKTMVVGKNKEHPCNHNSLPTLPISQPPTHKHTHTHTRETAQYTDMFKSCRLFVELLKIFSCFDLTCNLQMTFI